MTKKIPHVEVVPRCPNQTCHTRLLHVTTGADTYAEAWTCAHVQGFEISRFQWTSRKTSGDPCENVHVCFTVKMEYSLDISRFRGAFRRQLHDNLEIS